MTSQSLSAFLWSVADLLRGDYRQSEYGKVILPFSDSWTSYQTCLSTKDNGQA